MKRMILAVLLVILVSGCSTENQQNQQVSAAQPLTQTAPAAQPSTSAQPTQVQAATAAQTDPNAAATQTQIASNAQLTASEIQTQFIGVKMNWVTNAGRNSKGSVLYKPDNTVSWRAGRIRNGTGQWRLEGDKFCTYFPPRSGFQGIPWNCNPITRQGEKLVRGNTTYTKT